MLSKKQADFILAPFVHTLDVAEGTPRSGKTTACVLRYWSFLNISPDSSHLIVAATQTQAFRLAMDADGNGLLHLFQNPVIKHDDYGDYLEALADSGPKKIYYKGGAKSDSDKSIRGLSLGSVYFCEIDLLHPNMVQECFRRTYAAGIRWHLADLNPPPPQHPVIKDVFDVQDTNWTHWTPNDNPILTDARKEELRQTLARNPYLYRRDWLGERCIPEGVIYGMFDPAKHVLHTIPQGWQLVEMYFAGDGGLTDATSVGCYGVFQRAWRSKDYALVRLAAWYYDGGNKAMSVQAKSWPGTFAPWCGSGSAGGNPTGTSTQRARRCGKSWSCSGSPPQEPTTTAAMSRATARASRWALNTSRTACKTAAFTCWIKTSLGIWTGSKRRACTAWTPTGTP